jgi:glucosamine-6-phosphate deaminase
MRLIIEKDYESMSDRAVFIIKKLIENEEVKTIAFPTGKTPMLLYNKIADHYRNNKIDLSKITGFLVDEYYPISKESKDSFRYYIDSNFYNHVNLKKKYYYNSENKDFLQECNDYETKIKEEGGLDLVILGIGENGHIGFNEPGSSFNSRVRLVELKKGTIKTNEKKYKTKDKLPLYSFIIFLIQKEYY